MNQPAKSARIESQALGRGLLAALCAWLIPGAGHLFLGARYRALVFFSVVLVTVGLGLACDGNLSIVDGQRAPVLTGLQVVGNLAMGPVEPVIRRVLYGALVYRTPQNSGASVAIRRALEIRSQRFSRRFNVYGTAYLMAAGLMNMLLILDAWDIGIGRRE